MTQRTEQTDITKRMVVYQVPGAEAVTVRRDVEYGVTETGALTMDVYYPPDSYNGARLPAVVVVAGYPDLGVETILGCKFKEMGSVISWGRLAAASGIVAITYSNREPTRDIQALLGYVRQNALALGINEHRIGVLASSGNVPLALSVLMSEARDRLKCAVLCYGFMLDLDGSASVAEAAKKWRFVNPCAGKSIEDLPRDIPLFVVRAGQDEFPHLNETIDRFLARALACNLPITLINHAKAPHAFDLMHDSEVSKEIIKQILTFMRFHLYHKGLQEQGG